jgi:hypothetical protein
MRESTPKSPLVNQNVTGFRQTIVCQGFRPVGEFPPAVYGSPFPGRAVSHLEPFGLLWQDSAINPDPYY